MEVTCGGCNLFAIQSFTTNFLDAIKRKSGCFLDPPIPPDEQSLQSYSVLRRMVVVDARTLRPHPNSTVITRAMIFHVDSNQRTDSKHWGHPHGSDPHVIAVKR